MSEFVVRPFAFMRLTHEALRSGFQNLIEAANSGDIGQISKELHALQGVIDLHAKQEEEAFFPMLDAMFDDVATNGGLRDAHEREDAHQEALEAALQAGDLQAVRAAIDAWAPSFERHLKEEEDLMMPLTQKVADTAEGRAAAVRQILEVDWDGLTETHLPYVVKSLNDHKPYGPLRMFVAALQAASGDRFGELEPIVAQSVSAENAAMLRSHGHLN